MAVGRKRPSLIPCCCYVPAFALLFMGCGGGDNSGPKIPDPIEGPFAMITGASEANFSLSPDQNDTKCIPKPGLEEWEYESKDPASGNLLRIVLKDYKLDSRTLEMEYGGNNPKHEVVVEIEGGYRYVFFQNLRTNVEADSCKPEPPKETCNPVFNSHCTAEMTADDGDAFSGHISCTMLWADSNTPNYRKGVSGLNVFVDLIARFECERRTP